MGVLAEVNQWEATVKQIEVTDTVIGGAGGPPNVQAVQLANRTLFLKAAVDAHAVASDPHGQYLTAAEGNAAYDPAGGLAAHNAASDPHSQYLTPAEGDVLYKPINAIDVPVSTVLASASASVPAGFLECNGSSLLRASYAELFALVGTLYGATDASHFNLPDLRGEFIRGFDNGRGVDVGRGFGQWQNATHHVVDDDGFATSPPMGISNPAQLNTLGYESATLSGSDQFASGSGAGLATKLFSITTRTARPRNISMMFIIKY